MHQLLNRKLGLFNYFFFLTGAFLTAFLGFIGIGGFIPPIFPTITSTLFNYYHLTLSAQYAADIFPLAMFSA